MRSPQATRRLNRRYGFNFLYADQLTPALVARRARAMAASAGHRLAELGVREPRRAARAVALGRRPSIATRSRG